MLGSCTRCKLCFSHSCIHEGYAHSPCACRLWDCRPRVYEIFSTFVRRSTNCTNRMMNPASAVAKITYIATCGKITDLVNLPPSAAERHLRRQTLDAYSCVVVVHKVETQNNPFCTLSLGRKLGQYFRSLQSNHAVRHFVQLLADEGC